MSAKQMLRHEVSRVSSNRQSCRRAVLGFSRWRKAALPLAHTPLWPGPPSPGVYSLLR